MICDNKVPYMIHDKLKVLNNHSIQDKIII